MPADQIEKIVGATRRPHDHVARADSAEQIVHILHSADCLGEYSDLRECPFSVALDNGIHPEDWAGHQDDPVIVGLLHDPDDGTDWLVPACAIGASCLVAE